jgi:hypothetical protein
MRDHHRPHSDRRGLVRKLSDRAAADAAALAAVEAAEASLAAGAGDASRAPDASRASDATPVPAADVEAAVAGATAPAPPTATGAESAAAEAGAAGAVPAEAEAAGAAPGELGGIPKPPRGAGLTRAGSINSRDRARAGEATPSAGAGGGSSRKAKKSAPPMVEFDVKISDFGLSKLISPDEQMVMPCGTLSYVAPEVLSLHGYGKSSDLWSVGVVMFLLLRGRLPFDGATKQEIVSNTIDQALVMDSGWEKLSKEAWDLVNWLLHKNADKRITASQALKHPWVLAEGANSKR